MAGLLTFHFAVIARGRSALAGTVAFAVAAVVVTLLGLTSFRQLGVGAVGPAAVSLVNLALLLPTALAMLLAAHGVAAQRESGFLAAVIARGARRGGVILSVWLAVTAASWFGLLTGFGIVALILAGNVPMDDLPRFAGVVATAMLVAMSAAAVGVLVGMAVATRLQATVVGLAVWFMLAFGLDLLVIGMAVFARAGEPALILAVLANPLESGRVASLLMIDARGAVLGPLGTFLLSRLEFAGTIALLLGSIAAWTALPLFAARALLKARDL
jgi:Cu-processing system permease protein